MSKRAAPRLTPLADDPTQPSYMRELLVAGRDARVRGYDFERGLSKHLARLDAGAPLPEWAKGLQSSGAGAAAAAAGGSLIGWIAAPVLIGVAAAAAMLAVPRQASAPSVTSQAVVARAPAPQPVEPAQVAQVQVPAAAAPVATTPLAPSADAERTRASHAPRLLHARGTHAGAKTASNKHEHRARALERGAPDVARAADGSGTSASAPGGTGTDLFQVAQPARGAQQAVQPAPAPAAQPELPRPPTARQPAAQPPEPEAQDDVLLEREMGMLAMTQRVLLSDPARALRLARQGEAEFRGSMFTQERRQLLLLALVKLGRLDEAKRLAAPYLTQYPHGPFSDRVRRALATGKVEQR